MSNLTLAKSRAPDKPASIPRVRPRRRVRRIQTRPIQVTGYACIPRDFLFDPPICAASAPRKGQWTPYEFRIATTLLAEARSTSLRQQRHQQAFAKGGEFMARRRQNSLLGAGTEVKDFMGRKSGALTHRAMTRRMKTTGHVGYAAERERYAPEVLPLELPSASALLVKAGLRKDRDNQNRLDDTLDQLTKPVRVGEQQWPSLLRTWRGQPDGRLLFEINGAWLPQRHYGCIPLPSLIYSAPALALFLVLVNKGNNGNERTFEARDDFVCEVIGINAKQRLWRRDLERAIATMLDYRRALDIPDEIDCIIRLPVLQVRPRRQGNDKIIFVIKPAAQPQRDRDDDDDDGEVKRPNKPAAGKHSIERVRPSLRGQRRMQRLQREEARRRYREDVQRGLVDLEGGTPDL